nr:poly(3-hydroxybutyrate) depolymerase [Methylomarinum sp. Ch1-1]MDP4520804.1 poly(3-hydroxybutyrate) depolymerase [Methylomarinum sp. Ch1-1]
MLAPIVVVILLLLVDDDDEFAKMGTTSYAGVERQSCSPGSFQGQKGATYGEETPGGIKYNVRTPLNYDATFAHPLLVVYAPAQANRAKTERMTGLTYQATSLGFIVAYADHPELSTSSTVELGSIPEQVAKKWCIDKKRIYLTGHSDGGTVAMALAFMNGTRHIPSAIAPSAAGVSYRDLKTHSCPEPISVMVMHSKNDHLFPGYGSEASGWWAACNDCSPIPKTLENGCIAYTDCKNEVKTWYCEGEKIHAKWPQLNNVMLKFLASSSR